ncbi:HAMP domain-containing protein, partial [Longibaculum muris]|uniref:HAMP domain-containing protein n=1 Tax=Longibaculum muris TaxID=1796628 RepID=UPI003AB892A2
MKKYFRITLFKKVFLSIFCMILGIEIFHANQSYMNEVNYQKELLYLQIEKTMLDVITTNKLLEKYSHVYDKNFLNEFQKKTQTLSEYNCMILDKDYNEVDSGDYWINEKKMQRVISFFNNDQDYYINLYSLDNKILAKIEELLIQNMNQNKKSTITIDNDSLQLVKDEIYLEAKDLKYFNINGKTFIDNKSIEKKEYTITQYLSQNYFINYSLDQNEYGKFDDIKKVKELLIHQIKNSQDTQIVIDSHIIARIVNELKDNQGYLVTYAIYYDGIHDLQQKFFSEWFGFYVMLVFIIFAISWFLAHMFTRRIKKIDMVTQQITDNHFDIQLKEKPKDELGNLSKNINHMSHQLKQTIQQLNDEIEHVKKLESLRKDFINQFTHE